MDVELDTTQTLDEVLEVISEFLKESRNLALSRYNMVTKKKEPGQSFDEWWVSLKQLALYFWQFFP